MIVPTRNEAGNVAAALARTPVMGGGTELIFVEGHSTDDTWATIQKEIARYTGPLKLRAYQQTGKGKGDAVRLGFGKATGDILMILDADLTVPPEELPSFYDVIASGQADFVQGTRLVYPMEPGAMRFFNKLGNVAFSQLFTYLLQQPIKDTLCGTKVLWRRDYERIAAARAVLRRLRSVRRLRPHLRRRATEPEDRRDPGALPGSHLRHDQHRPLEARLAAAADVRRRRPQDQVRVSVGGRQAGVGAAAADGRPAGAHAGAVRGAPAGLGRRTARCGRCTRISYARIAAELPPEALGRRVELGSGPGFARDFIPEHRADGPGGRALARPRGQRRGAAVRRRQRGRARAVRRPPSPAVARGGSSPRRCACWRRAGRIVMCEPYVSPVSWPVYRFLHEEPLDLGVDPLAVQAQAGDGARDPFDANQAIPTLLFGRERQAFEAAFPALAIKRIQHLAGFSFPASGGFSHGPFLPWALVVAAAPVRRAAAGGGDALDGVSHARGHRARLRFAKVAAPSRYARERLDWPPCSSAISRWDSRRSAPRRGRRWAC